MPSTATDSSITGCNVDELVEAAKRSKFFYEIHRPPLYQHYQIEFRGSLAKVYFSIDRDTGNIIHADAWWIRPFL